MFLLTSLFGRLAHDVFLNPGIVPLSSDGQIQYSYLNNKTYLWDF